TTHENPLVMRVIRRRGRLWKKRGAANTPIWGDDWPGASDARGASPALMSERWIAERLTASPPLTIRSVRAQRADQASLQLSHRLVDGLYDRSRGGGQSPALQRVNHHAGRIWRMRAGKQVQM